MESGGQIDDYVSLNASPDGPIETALLLTPVAQSGKRNSLNGLILLKRKASSGGWCPTQGKDANMYVIEISI
jgi:hypothetical protein